MGTISHLLIITPAFPASEDDTTWVAPVQQFIHCFKRAYPNIKVSIVSLHFAAKRSNYKWYGLDVYAMGGESRPGLRRIVTLIRAITTALGINKGNKIDAVLSLWLTDGAFAGKIISSLIKSPHLIWMHGQDARPGNKYVRLVNPKPEQLAAISKYQNDVLFNSYRIRASHVIQNGINEAAFPEFNSGNRDIDLLAIGSLIPLKQYHIFIEVVKFIRENGHPNIRAMLAGGGPLMNELHEMIQAKGLSDNITLTGYIPHPDVLQLMNRAKIFVHPSEYEGHSTVMLEALYSGCKVVSFIPVGTTVPAGFHLCKNLCEMLQTSAQLLNQKPQHERTLYANLEGSARQIHDAICNLFQ